MTSISYHYICPSIFYLLKFKIYLSIIFCCHCPFFLVLILLSYFIHFPLWSYYTIFLTALLFKCSLDLLIFFFFFFYNTCISLFYLFFFFYSLCQVILRPKRNLNSLWCKVTLLLENPFSLFTIFHKVASQCVSLLRNIHRMGLILYEYSLLNQGSHRTSCLTNTVSIAEWWFC